MEHKNKCLIKSRTNRKIFGVCGGFGEYFNIDPTWIRLGWCASVILCGVGVVAYLVAALVMPECYGCCEVDNKEAKEDENV